MKVDIHLQQLSVFPSTEPRKKFKICYANMLLKYMPQMIDIVTKEVLIYLTSFSIVA